MILAKLQNTLEGVFQSGKKVKHIQEGRWEINNAKKIFVKEKRNKKIKIVGNQ